MSATAAIGRAGRLSYATLRARRLLGGRCGPDARIFGLAPIVEGNVTIGARFRCESPQFRSALTTSAQGRLEIGDGVFVNQGVTIHAASSIAIGNDVMLGDLVAIYDTNFHEVGPGEGVVTAPVEIGRNVWIARGAIVLPGVTIGAHSVIAAGAVVTGDVPAFSVAAGSPARVVRDIHAPDDYKRG